MASAAVGAPVDALAAPVLAAAASVAASRVVLGLHWLSDVLVGAAVGGLIGTSVWLVVVR